MGSPGGDVLTHETVRACYIVSLRYSPGLGKLFTLVGDNLQRYGWRVIYLLASEYAWLVDGSRAHVHYLAPSESWSDILRATVSFGVHVAPKLRALFKRQPPQFLLLYNTHPCNSAVARLARQAEPAGIRCIYLHEPYVPDKSSYGQARALHISVVEWLQTHTLDHTTCVIVPSPHAHTLFSMRFPDYHGKVYEIPLLLADKPLGGQSARHYVSLVGNLNRSRGPEDFLSLVNHASSIQAGLRFKLVTRSPLHRICRSLSCEAEKALSVVNEAQISDDEIHETVRESVAVFLPHRQASQSGVVPVAFRAATPIIARDIPGLSQHVHHGKNGYLVSYEPSAQELLDAVRFVQLNFTVLSAQARQDFEDIFCESHWSEYYDWLIGPTTLRSV